MSAPPGRGPVRQVRRLLADPLTWLGLAVGAALGSFVVWPWPLN